MTDQELANFIRSSTIENTVVKPIINDILEEAVGPGFVKFNITDYLNQVKILLDLAEQEMLNDLSDRMRVGFFLYRDVIDCSVFMPNKLIECIPKKFLFCMRDPEIVFKFKHDMAFISKTLLERYGVHSLKDSEIQKISSEVVDSALNELNVVVDNVVPVSNNVNLLSEFFSILPEIIVYGTLFAMFSVFSYKVYDLYITSFVELPHEQKPSEIVKQSSFSDNNSVLLFQDNEKVVVVDIDPTQIFENIDYIIIVIQFMMSLLIFNILF